MIPIDNPCVRFQFHRSDYTSGDIIACTCTCNYIDAEANELKQVIIRCVYQNNSDLADGFYISVYRDLKKQKGKCTEMVHSVPYLVNTSTLVGSDDYRRKFLRRVIIYSRPFIDYVLKEHNIRALPEKDIAVIYNSMLTKERNKLLKVMHKGR